MPLLSVRHFAVLQRARWCSLTRERELHFDHDHVLPT